MFCLFGCGRIVEGSKEGVVTFVFFYLWRRCWRLWLIGIFRMLWWVIEKPRVHCFIFLLDVVIIDALIAGVRLEVRMHRCFQLHLFRDRRVKKHHNYSGTFSMWLVLLGFLKSAPGSKFQCHQSKPIMTNRMLRVWHIFFFLFLIFLKIELKFKKN